MLLLTLLVRCRSFLTDKQYAMMSKFKWLHTDKKKQEEKQEEEESTTEVFRVVVPENVNPGEQFQTYAGTRIVLVRCPPNCLPGQALSITVPKKSQSTAIQQHEEHPYLPPTTYEPPSRRYEPPPRRYEPPPRLPSYRNNNKDTQLFEVAVPPGVQPGQSFSLIAGGQRILVSCPLNAQAGDKIRFNVPKELIEDHHKIVDETARIRIQYNKDGWARNVRLTDMKFQWVRMDDKGDIDLNKRFDIDRSAYVRKLRLRKSREGLRTGILSLVPAADAVADSCMKGADGRVLVSYTDLANAQVLSFEEKVKWFQETCDHYLKVPFGAGHMQINVRRDSIAVDSLNAILPMSRKDLRKYWKFSFLGELGLDAGGLTRAWFQLVTEALFDSDTGLWQSSAANQMSMQINPVSGKSFYGKRTFLLCFQSFLIRCLL